jgi:hypothetical protein
MTFNLHLKKTTLEKKLYGLNQKKHLSKIKKLKIKN